MSLTTFFTKNRAKPAAENASTTPQLEGESKEIHCCRVMLNDCLLEPLVAYRRYLAAGSERFWLTELNATQHAQVVALQHDLEAELGL